MSAMEPEHPIVKNMEATGYPDGKAPGEPVCPICKEPCEDIYTDRDGVVLGCDNCVTRQDACDVQECFQRPEKWDIHDPDLRD